MILILFYKQIKTVAQSAHRTAKKKYLKSSHLVSIPIIEDARVMTLLLYKDPLLLENPVVVDFLNFLPFKKLF